MAARPVVNWMKPKDAKGRAWQGADGNSLPAGWPVRLTSRHHLAPPASYEVFRLLPKPFWKFWGDDQVRETGFDAVPDPGIPASLGTRYWSDPIWGLGSPNPESGTASFRAVTDSGDAESGVLRSERVLLQRLQGRAADQVSGEVGAGVFLPHFQLGGRTGAGKQSELSWTAEVARDPWVEVSLLQGEEVLEHLQRLEDAFADGESRGTMRDLPGETLAYFVDRAADDASFTGRLEPGEPLVITVAVPHRYDLRGAICLRVRDLEDGSVTTSPPVFLTGLADQVLTTDLTLEMLRPEPRDLLRMLDETRLDVSGLAERLGEPAETTWQRLIGATEELGADSVADAVGFVALGLAVPA